MRTPQITRTTVAALGGIALLTTLAACSVSNADGGTAKSSSSPTPTATKSAAPQYFEPPADIEKSKAECKDGAVTVTQSNQDVTVPDCAKVTVDASNSIVHLGAVEHLVVTGSINDVAVKAVTTITVTGNGNRVTSDTAPKPKDSGDQNVFQKR
ncbi:DUF3060 domain-containing protein [Curtobacterium sp. PhB115]|uniref:DUF3060 domain-containing protein n=1 Tax=Curtobacterium sp. PhB115 TaxID=2485173 RepID=UPI000F98B93C|nr:DUF3060 domain-containing protein [Curtobacterium sp. PhB115]ROP74841.1 DUF3060 family protein [Curtobacterium sp. PhB115]